MCALDGAVRGHRPWWAVWVWRWAVAVTFGVAALGVAVLRGILFVLAIGLARWLWHSKLCCGGRTNLDSDSEEDSEEEDEEEDEESGGPE